MLVRTGFENPEIKYESVSTFQSSLLVKITGDPLLSFLHQNLFARIFLNPFSRLIFYFLDLFLDWFKMGDALEVKARKP